MNAVPTALVLEREAPPLRQDADGVICIGQTRVTLESVIAIYEQGAIDVVRLQDV